MSSEQLDIIHHLAIQVEEISRAVQWYKTQFKCEVKYQDATWALLHFQNVDLALVIPGQHPPHFAVTTEQAEAFGPLKTHRDGTRSVYIKDSEGNFVECMDPSSL
jgi:catechol-2,3-dioxygenase